MLKWFNRPAQSCGTCKHATPEKVGDTGVVQLFCAGMPPQLVSVKKLVDGKEVETVDGRFPVVPSGYRGCSLYKYDSSPKLV